MAEYDFAFRQMMSKNPKRSWCKIYNQMWNICLTDPANKGNPPNQHYGFGYNNNQSNNFSQANQHGQQKFSTNNNNNNQAAKTDYCWRYNKNGKCKFGVNCRYINKCSYCDATNHGLYNCIKKTDLTAKQGDKNE